VHFNSTADTKLAIHNDDNGTQSIELRGISVPAPQPEISVTTSSISFGAFYVGKRLVRDVTIRNVGAGLIVYNIRTVGSGAFSFPGSKLSTVV
jgi:hypothetical protein